MGPKEVPALYQLVFWFDILTFALMCASFALAYLYYSRMRLGWLRDYLVYLGCCAVWLLFSTYFFLQALYLPYPLGRLSLFIVVFRIVDSLGILYAGPLFALRIAKLPVERRAWWMLSIPVAFVFGTVLVFYSTGSDRVAIVPNGVFTFYLGAIFVVAAIRTTWGERGTGQADRLRLAFVPVLWFSAGAYAALLAANIVAVARPGQISPPLLNLGFAGAFFFVWSVTTIVIFLTRLPLIAPPAVRRPATTELPESFGETFGLTEYERAVAEDLLTGAQSDEIADKRLISPRTVDAHIAAVYRKCGITSREELMRLLEGHRPG